VGLDPKLISALQTSLAASISPLLRSPSQGADLYELYIWSLVIEAAKAEGALIEYRDVHGAPVTLNFVFRSSPGRIFSKKQPYTHARITFDQCRSLEAHIGIYVSGKSKVIHECDVAVIYADAATTCRAEEVHPKSTQLLLSAECKFYVQSTMGVGLARSYLGLVSEVKHSHRECYFVAVSESTSVERLFAHHQKDWETGVAPGDVKARPQRLRASFEKAFRNFKLRET
jgi:hypothetical protein